MKQVQCGKCQRLVERTRSFSYSSGATITCFSCKQERNRERTRERTRLKKLLKDNNIK